MKAAQPVGKQSKPGIGLYLFAAYIVILVLAAASELFDLGWFDIPLFK